HRSVTLCSSYLSSCFRRPPPSTLFPYTTLFRSSTTRHVFGPVDPAGCKVKGFKKPNDEELAHDYLWRIHGWLPKRGRIGIYNRRSEEHTSELQSRENLVCRLLLEKKKKNN